MGLIVNRKTGVPRVQWEKNGLVKRNPTINPDDIFDKCSTDKFPCLLYTSDAADE